MDGTGTEGYFEIAHITNLRRFPIQIIVNEPPESSATPTLFDYTGLIYLPGGKHMDVRVDQLDLGQIETLRKGKFIHVTFLDRDIDHIT